MSTSAQLPLCVYCGTARPADHSQCPDCGRPWIDVRVGAMAKSRVHVAVGAATTTETPNVSSIPITRAEGGEPDNDQLTVVLADDEEGRAPRFRRAIPIVLGLSALGVIAMFASGLLDENPAEPAPPTAQATATTQATAPPTSAPAPTTTAPPPTTTSPTTTIPALSLIGASGDPVVTSRLTLKAGGIGPIETGTPAQEALGRLVASLGAPEEVGVAGTEHGLCEGDDGRYVRWAQLTVIVLGTVADGTFVGYRYQEPPVPTSLINLATPSGIRLGDDVATLNETYASFTITYETVAGATTFRLFEDAELLLWGPVSSTDDNGRIEGIYSPAACDGP